MVSMIDKEKTNSESYQELASTEDENNESPELESCRAQVAEWKDKCMRISADFENFKRRSQLERATWMDSAQASILVKLLPIVDNFERAIAQAEEEQEKNPEFQAWLSGFVMMYESLKKILKDSGVTEITDTAFNPEFHEALMQVDSDEHESGEIVAVLEKGYRFKDTVLRPAKVSVAK
jgi:molecular chaperone GrpE